MEWKKKKARDQEEAIRLKRKYNRDGKMAYIDFDKNKKCEKGVNYVVYHL